MIEALSALLIHLFAALFCAVLSVGLVVVGVVRSAWMLFCWPSSWFTGREKKKPRGNGA